MLELWCCLAGVSMDDIQLPATCFTLIHGTISTKTEPNKNRLQRLQRQPHLGCKTRTCTSVNPPSTPKRVRPFRLLLLSCRPVSVHQLSTSPNRATWTSTHVSLNQPMSLMCHVTKNPCSCMNGPTRNAVHPIPEQQIRTVRTYRETLCTAHLKPEESEKSHVWRFLVQPGVRIFVQQCRMTAPAAWSLRSLGQDRRSDDACFP